jgi:hypothetical protein
MTYINSLNSHTYCNKCLLSKIQLSEHIKLTLFNFTLYCGWLVFQHFGEHGSVHLQGYMTNYQPRATI